MTFLDDGRDDFRCAGDGERAVRDTILMGFAGIDVVALDWDDDADTTPGMAFEFGDVDVDVAELAAPAA